MTAGTNRSPETEADAEIARLRPLFELLLGPECASRVFDEMAKNLDGFLNSPQTWFARIKDLSLEAGKQHDVAANFPALLEMLPQLVAQQQVTVDREYDRDAAAVAAQPGAAALVELIVAASEASSPADVLAETNRHAFPTDRMPLGPSPGLARIITKGQADPNSVCFEEVVSAVLPGVLRFAEGIYRQMLVSSLKLTHLVTHRPMSAMPQELGATVARCRDAWRKHYSSLLHLLSDPIRIVRNSEAHQQTEYDPRAETVTFVNLSRLGNREVLGPLDRNAFGKLVNDFMRLVVAMSAAFRIGGMGVRS